MEWALGAGYTDDLECDRLDSSKDYMPSNCRWVSRSQNIQNRMYRRDTPGISESGQKWIARINYGGKRFYLGSYAHKEHALFAYELAKESIRQTTDNNQRRMCDDR